MLDQLLNYWIVKASLVAVGVILLTNPQWWWPKLRDSKLLFKMRPYYNLPKVLRGSELEKLIRALETAQNERDKYKQQVEDTKVEYAKTLLNVSREYEQRIADKESELSQLQDKYKDRQTEYGKAVLWTIGREWESRGLTVAVQYIRIEESEQAKKIRSLLSYHLQSGDPLNSKKYPAEHINLPFNNPSRDARIMTSVAMSRMHLTDTTY